jgi:hypothetical protein
MLLSTFVNLLLFDAILFLNAARKRIGVLVGGSENTLMLR